MINNTCNELEELILWDLMSPKISFDFSTQGYLAKLKILDIDFQNENHNQYTAALQAMKSLETLKLWGVQEVSVQVVQMFDVISRLQNLRELHLLYFRYSRIPWTTLTRLRKVYLRGSDYGLENADLPNIIRPLINLELLRYETNHYCFHLCEKEFSKIVKVVARRDHVLTLECKVQCIFEIEKYCDEKQKVKLIKLRQ